MPDQVLRCAAAIALVSLVAAAPAGARPLDAPACTVVYDGDAGDGAWGTAQNWSGDAVPGPSDDVCIPSGFPIVSLPTAATVRSLDAPATSLAISGRLTSGTTRLAGADVAGGTLEATLSATSVNLRNGGMLAGGALTIGSLEWSGGTIGGSGTATVGELRVRGAAAKTLSARTLAATGASEITTALALADGATLIAGAQLALRGTLTGGGVRVTGTLTVTGTAAPDRLALDGGTLAGDGAVTADRLEWTAGTLAGAGTTTISQLIASGTAAKALNRALTLTGDSQVTANVAGTGSVEARGSVAVTDATLAARAYTQTDGTTRLAGGTIAAPVDLGGGTLSGSGDVGPLRNAATLSPTGTLRVHGDYTQTATGALRMSTGDRLIVDGTATLGGTLEVTAAAPPAPGAQHDLITAGRLTGDWAGTSIPSDGYTSRRNDTSWSLIATSPLPVPTAAPAAVPDPLPPDTPPVPEQSFRAQESTGEVTVKLPGASAGVPLTRVASLPNGTVVDTTKGKLTFTTAGSYTTKATTTITISEAIFQVRQLRARDGTSTVTDVLLSPPAKPKGCTRPIKGVPLRKVRANVKGLTRVFAGASVLTTRRATFAMNDRCDGTRTRLSRGRATSFHRVTGRTAKLRARRTYLAKARLFAARQLQVKTAPRP